MMMIARAWTACAAISSAAATYSTHAVRDGWVACKGKTRVRRVGKSLCTLIKIGVHLTLITISSSLAVLKTKPNFMFNI